MTSVTVSVAPRAGFVTNSPIGRRGQQSVSSRLTNEQAIDVLMALHDETMPVAELAEHYGVTPGAICHMRVGRSWGWLSDALAARNYQLTAQERQELCGGQTETGALVVTAPSSRRTSRGNTSGR